MSLSLIISISGRFLFWNVKNCSPQNAIDVWKESLPYVIDKNVPPDAIHGVIIIWGWSWNTINAVCIFTESEGMLHRYGDLCSLWLNYHHCTLYCMNHPFPRVYNYHLSVQKVTLIALKLLFAGHHLLRTSALLRHRLIFICDFWRRKRVNTIKWMQ